MTEEQEKRNRKIAMITSLGVHGVLLLILLLIVAWRAPNPPLPEYGIELNFGTVDQGSGNIQPQTSASAEPVEPEQEVEPIEDLPVPDQQEITEEVPEVTEETTPVEAKPVEPEVISKVESPVVVEEKKEVKPVEKPTEKPAEKVVEKKPEVKPQPEPVKEVPKAVYKPKTEGNATGTANQGNDAPSSQGDDVDRTGDKGDEKGTIDAKALYGKHGGGGGGVSMSGFKGFGWPPVETPPLPDQSYGKYEFSVKVDERGYVISVTPLQRGLSFEAERRLKAAIQKLQFVPQGTNLPAESEGKITFSVVSSATN